MPGSEGGDRVHNFFDQEKFSRQHSQVVDGSRLVSSGIHWPGNQRHETSPLNFGPRQSASDLDRGNLDRQSSLIHSSPFLQSPQRPTFISSPYLTQQTGLNGYVHDHHILQAKHDESDFMGMNRESNQHNPFSRGLLNSGAQFRNVPEQHRDARLEATESPINFDFLGSNQQMSNQQLAMLQSSPRQYSGLNERQLLQQQAMLRNVYDVQRRQQLQKQNIRQMNSVNSLSIGQQTPNDRSPSNNMQFQDVPNYAWTSQHGAGNPSWLQGAVSPVMQGTSNGISFSTEQSPSNIFGFSTQSVDHSLYGFPISDTRCQSIHRSHSMEKPMPSSQQVPSERIPLPANQYGTLPGQVSAQDREFGSRFGFQTGNNFKNVSSQASYPGTTIGNVSQVESQQKNPSMEFLGIQGVSSSSMNSKENTLSQTVILQDAAPLDPTEEQFLFGCDDNIWDAFGKSSNSNFDGYKMVEGSQIQNPIPYMQRGSWSALMQSALSETCSGDTGNQEEWSGLNLSGKQASALYEPFAFSSSEKPKTSVTNGNLQIEPSLDASHYLSLDKSRATNPHSMQGFPLSSLSGSSNVDERFQFKSASKSNQQISESNGQLDHGKSTAQSEDNQIHRKSGHNPAAALNFTGSVGAGAPQHGTLLNNIGNQGYTKSSHAAYMGSAHGGRSPARSTSNENIVHPKKDEQKRLMHEEMQKDKSAWTRNLFPNSPGPIGQLNATTHVATAPNINSLQDNLNQSENPPISHHFNHWKHVGSIPVVGSENVARSQHPPDARPHFSDASFNNSVKKIQASALGDFSKHENYVHLQQSSFWDNASGNRLQDAFMSGQSNRNVADGKHKVSDQVAGNSPGHRQYQHHYPGQGQESSTQNVKGKVSNSHTDVQKLHEASSVGLPMHHLGNKSFQSSQNMVELLNKARKSSENNAEASRNSSEHNMISEKSAAESPDTSMSHLQQNQFLGSQTYGLQLGPPHQRFPTQICGSSHNLSQPPSSLGLNSVQFEAHQPLAASQAELHKVLEHSSASISSGPPNSGNQLQNQQAGIGLARNNLFMPADNMLAKASIMQSSAGTQFKATGSKHLPSSSSQADIDIQSHVRPRDLGFPSSWSSVPNQQNSSQADIVTSQSHMKPSVTPPIKKDEQNLTIRGNDSPGSGAPNTTFTSKSSRQEQHATGSSWKSGTPDETGSELKAVSVPWRDGFPMSDTVTYPTRESSGNSVKPDGTPQNSYSLLHQLQVRRSTEIDPNNRDSKRQKVQSISSDTQQSPSRFGQHQNSFSPTVTEIGNSNLAVSDSKLGKIIPVPSIHQGRYFPSQHGSAPFQNNPTFGQNDTQNSHNGCPAVSTIPLTEISPKMTSSWFEQYGSLNRELLVPASDVWKHSVSRPLQVGHIPVNSSIGFRAQNHVQQIQAPVNDQVGDMKYCSAPVQTVVEQAFSPQLTAFTSPSLVSHKLKTETLELVPWHKEVAQHGLQYLPNISASEVKWANATKRIPEKVTDEVEQADNRTLKCKRRLVLTTQLMQQLLDPPPASVMSSDAYMNHESVVYFTSRVSCGSACSLSGLKNNSINPNHNNMISKKVPEQGDDLWSKVENGFFVRTYKLENALSSLEKQTSIQDLRIEWQDVEKFSVINRFAKFHGRGQADGHPITNSQNHGPQRYVTALPSPQNLPDIVQCLSL